MQVVALIDEENGTYGVSFPDFPGCTTVADSLDAAVARAAEVLAFHVEGLAEDGLVPESRSMGELMRDPEFRAARKNALAVLVPYQPPSRAVRINITLEESLLERIDRAASRAGDTRSGYLAQAAKERLAEDALIEDGAAGKVFAEVARTKRRYSGEPLSPKQPARPVRSKTTKGR
jgi:predicted RNase H-like HicB family nuclease